MGFPIIRPFYKCINKYLSDVRRMFGIGYVYSMFGLVQEIVNFFV
jgi:hypothetical protein